MTLLLPAISLSLPLSSGKLLLTGTGLATSSSTPPRFQVTGAPCRDPVSSECLAILPQIRWSIGAVGLTGPAIATLPAPIKCCLSSCRDRWGGRLPDDKGIVPVPLIDVTASFYRKRSLRIGIINSYDIVGRSKSVTVSVVTNCARRCIEVSA